MVMLPALSANDVGKRIREFPKLQRVADWFLIMDVIVTENGYGKYIAYQRSTIPEDCKQVLCGAIDGG
jgi:hypothetical protein